MDILTKLFGSAILVKVMRMFLFHPDDVFDTTDIRKQTRAKADDVRWAVTVLMSIDFLKKKSFSKTVAVGKGDNTKTKRKKAQGYILNDGFVYFQPLRSLLLNAELINNKDIVKRIRQAGIVKLVLISGVFLQHDDARVDLLIVGDKIKYPALQKTIKSLEADLGTHIRYAVFDTKEFEYRLSIYDKLVHDILQEPHEKLLNKLEV